MVYIKKHHTILYRCYMIQPRVVQFVIKSVNYAGQFTNYIEIYNELNNPDSAHVELNFSRKATAFSSQFVRPYIAGCVINRRHH